MRDLRIRWAIVALSLLASAWYLWPTVRRYSMSPEARDELQRTDPAAWDRLKTGAIQLGLDLQGGMHLVLELDQSDREILDGVGRLVRAAVIELEPGA